ncbi:hypothetical protein [Haloarcula salina]|uniref:Uncharacterized protein n=1 Tax=Haloarcula salina TaxID=1429914 RepID=A0AA41G583_9EURY|nr:hypothetical protein [Haloarcula salina]MBV0903844.1 hypothetical protein [Haloarcula salina]
MEAPKGQLFAKSVGYRRGAGSDPRQGRESQPFFDGDHGDERGLEGGE